MKIAHIITRMIVGGAQENTIFTVEGMIDRGHEVTLVTGPSPGPEGSLLRRIKGSRAEIIEIKEMQRELNPLKDTAAFLKILKLLKRNRYDIVHTHSSKAGIIGRLAAKKAGIRTVIHTIHGLPYHKYQSLALNRFYKICEKSVAGLTDKYIAVSEAMKQQSLAAGVSREDKYRIIRSGFDLTRYLKPLRASAEIRRSLNIPPDAVLICKIARLFHLKGHEYILESFSRLAPGAKNIYLLLVGDGILRNELERKAEQLGIKENTVFAGLIDPEEIPDYINAADMLVHTSLREGLAKAIPQAYACSKPVVSFDIDGAGELVKNDLTGYLVPPKDTALLAEAIDKLVENSDLRYHMGQKGKSLILPYYDKNYMVDEIEKLYMKECAL
ncbi:MAG: glycosyltransferase family 4 protein [Candidatus Aureabacteria bacterium]|nr:glycosyltransferase family 4 protein [Candidatus Auribacterota bacterium]